MSTPESNDGACSASSPFQSGQRQSNEEDVREERLASSLEQSPRSHDSFIETQIAYDVIPALTADDNASSGGVSTPEQHASRQRDQALPSASRTHPTDANSPPSRPNNYHGPPSTWRNWTAAERELAASLQQLTANDLSVHLYNAFHLKSRPRSLRRGEEGKHGGVVEGAETWAPPKVWTAWPLPPEIVPREGHVVSWEEEGGRPTQTYGERDTSSRGLKELLVGYVLKKAKERFWAKEWEDDEPSTRDGKPRRKWGRASEQPKSTSEDPDLSSPDDEQSERASSSSERSEVGDDDEHSQSAEASSNVEDEALHSDGDSDQSLGNFEPEVMLDDDKASDILEPTMNHILARFDSLLTGLHHARSAYMAPDESASESQKDVDELQRLSRGKRKRSKSRQGRGRPRIYNESLARSENDTAEGRMPSSTSRIRSQRSSSSGRKAQSFRNRTPRIGLRGWSDILGIASMTGWESAIIEKTATRCAALFEEGISFRTLAEGKDEVEEVSYLPGLPKQPKLEMLGKGFAGGLQDSRDIEGDKRLVGGVHVDTFLQPIEAEHHWKRKQRLGQSARRSRQSREQ